MTVCMCFYRATSPEQTVLHVNKMSWGSQSDLIHGMLHNSAGAQRTYTQSFSLEHTHLHKYGGPHIRPGQQTRMLTHCWYVRELQKPLHLQTENKNMLCVYSQVGRSRNSDFQQMFIPLFLEKENWISTECTWRWENTIEDNHVHDLCTQKRSYLHFCPGKFCVREKTTKPAFISTPSVWQGQAGVVFVPYAGLNPLTFHYLCSDAVFWGLLNSQKTY